MFNKTVKELLKDSQGKAPGFDTARLLLGTLVVAWHSVSICYREENPLFMAFWIHPAVHPFLKMILPMFFFLSGFLVTASAYRAPSTFNFLSNRILRIFPALGVEVVLSAVLLGAMYTALPLEQYYSHPAFFSYFKNCVGRVQFYLPGVFGSHPCPIVNGNLWTLPSELQCYLGMTALMVTGILYQRRIFLAVFILACLSCLTACATIWSWGDHGLVFVRPQLLVASFFIGVFCFIYSDKIKISKPLFFLSILGLGFFNYKPTTLCGLVSACYLCLCVGFMDLRKFPLTRSGDYSYSIYLYGFPIQQAVWQSIPLARSPVSLFLFSFPLTLLVSVLSWRYIEKPFLRFKRHVQPEY